MPRIVSFLIFLAIALSLIVGMHYYVWARLVRDPHLPPTFARLLTVVIVGLGVSMPLALIASRLWSASAVRPAVWVAFVWMGMGFLLVAFFGLADLGRLAASLAARLRGAEPDPARRLFLARSLAAGVGGVVAGLTAVGMRSALGSIRIKELEIGLRGLPRELAGFRLVQISDVHVGPLLRKDWVGHVVDQVRALSPDLVAITGDLVDGTVAELREAADSIVQLYGTSLRLAAAYGAVLQRPVDRSIYKAAIGTAEFLYRSLRLPRDALPWFASARDQAG